MITNYSNFKPPIFEKNDRVICRGKAMFSGHSIDFEGQTAIIVQVNKYATPNYRLFFDNAFSPFLTDFDNKIYKCVLNVSEPYLEKIITPTTKYPLTKFSKKLRNILEYIEYMNYNFHIEMDYIDVGKDKNNITYIPFNKMGRLEEGEDPYNNKFRENMSIGRFLKKLNPYTNAKNIERKANIYKAMYQNFIEKTSTFKMVQGMEVIDWYQEEKYFPGKGHLNNSCMRRHWGKLSLYNDPKRVAMLILLSPDNRLLGRALVWNVTDPNITYMDRVYTVFPDDEERFYLFSEENGWNNFRDNRELNMVIKYDHSIGDEYDNPYMDTFIYFVAKGKHGKNYLTTDVDDNYDIELTQTESERDDYDDDY